VQEFTFTVRVRVDDLTDFDVEVTREAVKKAVKDCLAVGVADAGETVDDPDGNPADDTTVIASQMETEVL